MERKFPGCTCSTPFEIRNLLTRRYDIERRDSSVGRCCVFAWLYLRKLLRNEELSSVSCLICARILARIYGTFKYVKMRLTDLHDSHCVCVVLIKAFTMQAILLLYKSFFPFDQNVMRPLCLIVFILIVRGNSHIY